MAADPYIVLRKKLAHIENQIDNKLRYLSGLSKDDRLKDFSRKSKQYSTSEREPLLEESDSYEDVKNELDALFEEFSTSLTEINDVVRKSGNPVERRVHVDGMHATYNSCLSEFKRIHAIHSVAVDKAKLLASPRLDTGSGRTRKTDFALKENESAMSSSRLVDDHISVAIETKERLRNQRSSLKSVQTRMNDVLNHFPRVNSLIVRIQGHKQREAIIVGLVVGFCTILTLSYIFLL